MKSKRIFFFFKINIERGRGGVQMTNMNNIKLSMEPEKKKVERMLEILTCISRITLCPLNARAMIPSTFNTSLNFSMLDFNLSD